MSVFSQFLAKKLTFRSQHTNCATYYDDVISCDVTLLASKMFQPYLAGHSNCRERGATLRLGGGGGGEGVTVSDSI